MWLHEFEEYGAAYGTAAYSDRHDLKGNTQSRMLDCQESAIAYGIERWLELGRKSMAYALVVQHVRDFDSAHGHLVGKEMLSSAFVDKMGRLKPPSLRTFERRCALVDPMVRTWSQQGPALAKQRYRTYQTTANPDRPYSEVEVDHCTLDIVVIDASDLLLGRPDLIVFRDRATAMILGYGLGFEAPSYASFVQGLKHAIYPKDVDRHPSLNNPWPCYGRIENLFVDNALHFLGDNIRSAGRELGFNLVKFEPRQPWLKGGLERLFSSMNTGLLHSLPGSTLSNVIARRDHEHLGWATLTLAELEFLLNFWIRDIYHADARKALGPIRGVGDSPLRVWAEKAKTYRTPLLPHEDVFISLAGDVEKRTIQKDGIVWDYIKYEDPKLWLLLCHPSHKAGRGGTKYKVIRDPFNLSHIYAVDHYNNAVIEVPATLGHRAYSNGLTLHQHQVIISNAHKTHGEKIDIPELEEAKARLAEIVVALKRHPGRRKIVRAIGRYLDSETGRRRSTELLTKPPQSGSSLLSYAAVPEPTAPKSHTSGASSSSSPIAPTDGVDDCDLDDLERMAGVRSYRG